MKKDILYGVVICHNLHARAHTHIHPQLLWLFFVLNCCLCIISSVSYIECLLLEVLDGQMLQSWTERAQEVHQNGWYWEYELTDLTIESVNVKERKRGKGNGHYGHPKKSLQVLFVPIVVHPPTRAPCPWNHPVANAYIMRLWFSRSFACRRSTEWQAVVVSFLLRLHIHILKRVGSGKEGRNEVFAINRFVSFFRMRGSCFTCEGLLALVCNVRPWIQKL